MDEHFPKINLDIPVTEIKENATEEKKKEIPKVTGAPSPVGWQSAASQSAQQDMAADVAPSFLTQDEKSSMDYLKNPAKRKKKAWEEVADKYFEGKSKSDFVNRFLRMNISAQAMEVFIKSLELSAEDGVAFNQFLAYWRLLPGDVPQVAERYPALARAIKIVRELRKRTLMDAVIGKAHQAPGAAMTALKSEDFTGDALLEHDEKEAQRTVEDKAEEMLLNAGVKPCEYVQVVQLQGDLPNKDHFKIDDHDKIGLSPEQVIALLSKQEKPKDEVELPAASEKEVAVQNPTQKTNSGNVGVSANTTDARKPVGGTTGGFPSIYSSS